MINYVSIYGFFNLVLSIVRQPRIPIAAFAGASGLIFPTPDLL